MPADPRLLKRWEILERLLSEAGEQIIGSEQHSWLKEYIEYNEFGLALDVLDEAGAACQVNAEYWRLLKKAAEVMGDERRKAFQRKFQQARIAAAP